MCEKTNDAYTTAIDYLKTSPMFNLSLSSKELFHSNFLYWLSLINKEAFKKLIAGLLNIRLDELNLELNWGDNWEVAREYKSFDLCVKDISKDFVDSNPEDTNEENRQKPNIYLVIENKVKSIPYKAQLKKYTTKVKEYYGNKREEDFSKVKYMLLTLPTHFPDAPEETRSECQNSTIDNWKIVTYNRYIEVLTGLKNEFTSNLENENKCYATKIMEDYIEFVNNLLVLHNHWKENCYEKLGFLRKEKEDNQMHGEYVKYITDAENLRIHDLYHKSKYARICTDIIAKFNEEIVNIENKYDVGINVTDKDIFNHLEARRDKGYIVWEYNYMHGEPLVGVKITKRDKDNFLITYIIQVQSGVYEHGIIANHRVLSETYSGTQDKTLWNYVSKHSVDNVFKINETSWMRYENFENDATKDLKPLRNSQEVLASAPLFDKSPLYPEYKKRKDTLPYAKYAGDNSNVAMIYQYRKLKIDVKTEDVISYMIDDVKNLLKALQ